MSCSLGRSDIERAKEIFSTMPDDAQDEPETRYILFKAAIMCDEEDLAVDCLDRVSKSKDDQLLYACATDAITSDKKMCALEALRRLTLKYDFQAPTVHLPALLRCSIRTNIQLLKEDEASQCSEERIQRLRSRLCEASEAGT